MIYTIFTHEPHESPTLAAPLTTILKVHERINVLSRHCFHFDKRSIMIVRVHSQNKRWSNCFFFSIFRQRHVFVCRILIDLQRLIAQLINSFWNISAFAKKNVILGVNEMLDSNDKKQIRISIECDENESNWVTTLLFCMCNLSLIFACISRTTKYENRELNTIENANVESAEWAMRCETRRNRPNSVLNTIHEIIQFRLMHDKSVQSNIWLSVNHLWCHSICRYCNGNWIMCVFNWPTIIECK